MNLGGADKAVSSAEPTGADEGTDSSLLELTKGLGRGEKEEKEGVKTDQTIPPSTPESGISILAHKIWIGNLDKRLSQLGSLSCICLCT